MTATPEDQQFERLVQKIAPRSRLLRRWHLKGGISAGMTALEIADPDGHTRRLVVRRLGEATLRQNPHAAQDEFRLLQVMHALGLATPMPHALDQTGEIFPTPYLVIEYIEGEVEFAPANPADFVIQMAEHLAKIHSVDGSRPDLSFLPRQAHGFSAIIGKRPAEVNEPLDEGRIRDVLESASSLAPRNAPALLHGDYWPGNILWRDGRLAAVIDWEDAQLGEPLSDLAISRLDILWIFGLDTMNAFTQQYQSRMTIDYAHLPYWDLCAALRLVRLAGADLARWAAFFPPFGRHDITERSIREYYRLFIAQAFEKLAS